MTGTITYDVGGVRWSLRPDLFERREELFGSDGLRLPEWLASGAANIDKAGEPSVDLSRRAAGAGLPC